MDRTQDNRCWLHGETCCQECMCVECGSLLTGGRALNVGRERRPPPSPRVRVEIMGLLMIRIG
jgi:hypothetical protein